MVCEKTGGDLVERKKNTLRLTGSLHTVALSSVRGLALQLGGLLRLHVRVFLLGVVENREAL